ncbi:LysR family transcriptional regulator [Ensifer sp. ENS06]|uniref:LysR family transcriptional regulator n=1 Tax=Ensifer sp. ENS06 TaxID=2769276 RepID=UPI000DDE7250|nr:LysR family transcriptional regulator [Ensifer sp. ENS06]MBD9624681.1 LysR family transcriptional regulator [Ensifer sp. ENS06]
MDQKARRFVWNLDWNLLRTFVVIVQERGITAASEKLLRKQPTISQALRRLEVHLGCTLIERSPGSFKITPAGERLYAECQTMFVSVASLHDLTQVHAADLTGNVSMAFASHVVSPFLDKVLEDFHKTYPLVSFTSTVLSSHEVIQRVSRRDDAVGFCLMHQRDPRLQYTTLYREYFGYFCGKPHPFYGRDDITLEDMRQAPYVSFLTDQMSDALWPVALLRQQAMLQGKVVGVSSHLEEVRRFIVAGCGFGPLPVHVVAEDVRKGTLWPLPPLENQPSVEVYMVTDPHARHDPAETQLLRMLFESIESTPIDQRTYRGA